MMDNVSCSRWNIQSDCIHDDEMESEFYDFVYLVKVSGTICIAGEFYNNQWK